MKTIIYLVIFSFTFAIQGFSQSKAEQFKGICNFRRGAYFFFCQR